MALANLRRHDIRVYGTFVFGYDGDQPGASPKQAAEFSIEHRFYSPRSITSRPFPARRCTRGFEAKGGCCYERWWLDDRYRYNDLPFRPRRHGARRRAPGLHRPRADLLQLEEHADAPSTR